MKLVGVGETGLVFPPWGFPPLMNLRLAGRKMSQKVLFLCQFYLQCLLQLLLLVAVNFFCLYPFYFMNFSTIAVNSASMPAMYAPTMTDTIITKRVRRRVSARVGQTTLSNSDFASIKYENGLNATKLISPFSESLDMVSRRKSCGKLEPLRLLKSAC